MINIKYHHKIFERFYRLVGKDKQTYSGFGFELFIANPIFEGPQDFVIVNSEMDKGLKFIFTLYYATHNNLHNGKITDHPS